MFLDRECIETGLNQEGFVPLKYDDIVVLKSQELPSHAAPDQGSELGSLAFHQLSSD